MAQGDLQMDSYDDVVEKDLLAAAKKIHSYGLGVDALKRFQRLLARQPEGSFMLQRTATAHLIWDMEREPWFAEECITVPTNDSADVVRLVHESTCPTCGSHAYITEVKRVKVENIPTWNPDVAEHPDFEYYIDLPEWDTRCLITVECVNGHSATAEPTRHDWVGYRNND